MEAVYRPARGAAEATQRLVPAQEIIDIAANAGVERQRAAGAVEDWTALAVWAERRGALELPFVAVARPPE
eukprot:11156157-Lingulodinium_polyedra.AAC.1